ncbi:MAG: winged helix-turn-helix transcriptional regulator [Chitinophagaceae bacterium]|nr:winged helix-turn-helix transcriptional regulator [Chitinophagaceae bacterium]
MRFSWQKLHITKLVELFNYYYLSVMEDRHIQQIRAFNRFYTPIIGLLDKYILHSSYTLPEVRIMYEVFHDDGITATELVARLGIDKGYLSKMILQLENRKLLSKKPCPDDGRSVRLSLTGAGRKEFVVLNKAASDEVREMLAGLSNDECDKLISNMLQIKKMLINAGKKAEHEWAAK